MQTIRETRPQYGIPAPEAPRLTYGSPAKTLTDYLVIAISPALIMTLVGSLVYFLIAVSYQGGFPGRVSTFSPCSYLPPC